MELKVDPDILVRRIQSRVEQMKLRGEPLRPDDSPDVLKQRLAAYETQTAPLVAHYKGKSMLRSVDGMASIEEVAQAIGRHLAEAAFRPASKREASRVAGKGSRAKKTAGGHKPVRAAPARKAGPKSRPKPVSRRVSPGRKNAVKPRRGRRLTK
jgi:adenylate kinase